MSAPAWPAFAGRGTDDVNGDSGPADERRRVITRGYTPDGISGMRRHIAI